jgi:hypothetical protein
VINSQPPDAIRRRLRPGERILWSGRPNLNAYAMRGVWYLLPFSIVWLGFAIFWELGVISSRAPFPFALFGIPFVGMGVYMVFGRLIVATREAERATYAVTDQRVILITGAFQPAIVEMDLADLPPVQLAEAGSGVGTITFGPAMGYRVPPGWPTMGQALRPTAFESIPDAATAYRILQDARSALRPTQMR